MEYIDLNRVWMELLLVWTGWEWNSFFWGVRVELIILEEMRVENQTLKKNENHKSYFKAF